MDTVTLKIKKILLSPWLALFTFTILLAFKLQDPYLVEATRLKFYDYIMLDKAKQSQQIVVINLGEKSIDRTTKRCRWKVCIL